MTANPRPPRHSLALTWAGLILFAASAVLGLLSDIPILGLAIFITGAAFMAVGLKLRPRVDTESGEAQTHSWFGSVMPHGFTQGILIALAISSTLLIALMAYIVFR